MGPIALVYLGNSVLSLVTKTKLLGLIVLETKKSFVKKMDFLKHSCFFTKNFKGLKGPSDSSGC